jgi:hypothetical protein
MHNKFFSVKQTLFAMVLFLLVSGFPGCNELKQAFSGGPSDSSSAVKNSNESLSAKDKPAKTAYNSPFSAKSDDASIVLAEFADGSRITEKVLDDYLKVVLENMPMPMDRDSIGPKDKKDLFENILRVKLIELGFGENVIGSKEFDQKIEEVLAAESQKLLFGMFLEKMQGSIDVTAANVRSEYEENKLRYLKQPGGVMLGAVKFESDAYAQTFRQKVAAENVSTIKGLETVAAGFNGGTFKSFGRVSEKATRSAPEDLVEKVLLENVDKYPFAGTVAVGEKEHWVFLAESKVDDVYLSFDEASPMISEMLQQRLLEGKVTEAVATFEKKWLKNLNKDYFAAVAE